MLPGAEVAVPMSRVGIPDGCMKPPSKGYPESVVPSGEVMRSPLEVRGPWSIFLVAVTCAGMSQVDVFAPVHSSRLPRPPHPSTPPHPHPHLPPPPLPPTLSPPTP